VLAHTTSLLPLVLRNCQGQEGLVSEWVRENANLLSTLLTTTRRKHFDEISRASMHPRQGSESPATTKTKQNP
jgi:hypothetical protein